MYMMEKRKYFLIFVAVSLVFLAGCGKKRLVQNDQIQNTPPATETKPVEYQAYQPKVLNCEQSLPIAIAGTICGIKNAQYTKQEDYHTECFLRNYQTGEIVMSLQGYVFSSQEKSIQEVFKNEKQSSKAEIRLLNDKGNIIVYEVLFDKVNQPITIILIASKSGNSYWKMSAIKDCSDDYLALAQELTQRDPVIETVARTTSQQPAKKAKNCSEILATEEFRKICTSAPMAQYTNEDISKNCLLDGLQISNLNSSDPYLVSRVLSNVASDIMIVEEGRVTLDGTEMWEMKIMRDDTSLAEINLYIEQPSGKSVWHLTTRYGKNEESTCTPDQLRSLGKLLSERDYSKEVK